MIRNLAASLITHERVKTTLPKARNLRPFVEKLVTLSKEATVHRRRLVQSRLGDKTAAKKLFEVIGPRFKGRPGGYLRILKMAKRRLGDGGEQLALYAQLVAQLLRRAIRAPAQLALELVDARLRRTRLHPREQRHRERTVTDSDRHHVHRQFSVRRARNTATLAV